MKNFKNFGVMLDVSRNAVMNMETLKRFIDYLAKMGYDTLELYAEDTYKIESEPYFGYQRGGYTQEELKEIDAYCIKLGIELIPCIQTLAHFTNLLRLPRYYGLKDVNDILLIDSPRTYELIEKIIANCAASFTSRKINIGMDEAFLVGLGRYLRQNGYTDRFELLNRHLAKVCKITEKYGFKPHMWSDMYFRLAQKGEYYRTDADLELEQSIVDAIPENIELVYWDYYHTDKAVFDVMLSQHKKFKKELWFAGGAWTWSGFAPSNYFSLKTMKPAIQSVIEQKIDRVLITMWGDNGKECSSFAAIPSLFAISEYAKGNFDEGKIAENFEKLFGLSFDDFMSLDLPNRSKWAVENEIIQDTSKVLLYQDCFMGIFDDINEKEGKLAYASFAKKLFDVGEKTQDFKYLFDCLGDLCLVLDKKMMLGVETRKLYKSKDKEGLRALTKQYDEVVQRIKQFHKSFKSLWFKENKAFGWEVQDARLGGLAFRVETCKERLENFISGEIDAIPELEEEVLSFTLSKEKGYKFNSYTELISRSSI